MLRQAFKASISKNKQFAHLSHPFILDLGNLGIGVPHHGNQQVDQKNKDNRQEEETQNLKSKQTFSLSNFTWKNNLKN